MGGRVVTLDLSFKNIYRLQAMQMSGLLTADGILDYFFIEKSNLENKEAIVESLLHYLFQSLYVSQKEGPQTFCLIKDFGLVYSLFLEKYKIDLLEDESFLWTKFILLIDNIFFKTSLGDRCAHREQPDSSIAKYNKDYYKSLVDLNRMYKL